MVQEDATGQPVSVLWRGQRVAVEGIQDIWRIDDEWWRKEISRLYYQVVLSGGRLLTLFRDLLEGQWFMQPVTIPKKAGENLHILVRRAPMEITRVETLQATSLRRCVYEDDQTAKVAQSG